MAARGGDIKELLLQVDASVELARRNLSTLATQVQSDSAKMDASLGRVDKAADRLGGVFNSMKTNVVGAIAAISVGTFVSLGKQALQLGDDLEAAAEKAGVGVERYQTLKGALRALEVDGDKADKMFQVLHATLGDVQNGADNGATQALDRLGIRAKVLDGEITTTDQLLDALGEAAKGAGSQAQFTSDIVDIFGKKVGVDLATALADGGAALHQGEDDLRRYGNVLSEEMIDRLADANESIDLFLEQTSAHFAIWAANVIKSVGAVATEVSRIANMRPTQAAARAASKASPYMASAFPWLMPALAAGSATISAYAGGTGRGQSTDEVLRGVFSNFRGMDAALPASVAPPKPLQLGGSNLRGRRGGGGGGRSGRGSGRSSSRGGRSSSSRDSDVAPWLRLDDPIPMGIDNLDFSKPLSDILGVKEATADISGLIANLPPVPDMGDLLKEEQEQRIRDFLSDFTQDLASGLANAIVSGDNLGDVLVNSIKRAAAALIESGLMELFGQLLGTAAGGSGGGGGGGGIWAGIAGLFGGHRAAGGFVAPRTPYMVGERGPEIFIPRVAGHIRPHSPERGGAGRSVSLTVNAPGATAETVSLIRRELRAAAPAIVAAAQGSTMRALRRPRLS